MGCRLILVALALFVWVASGISVAAATDQMDEIDAKSRLRDLEELLNVWLAPLTSDVQELAKRLRRVEEKLPTVLASQSVDWSRVRACQSDVSPRVKAFHEQLLTAVKASATRMEETGAEYRRHQDEYRQAQARRVDQVALIDMYFNQKVRYHEALQARSRVTRVMAIVEAFKPTIATDLLVVTLECVAREPDPAGITKITESARALSDSLVERYRAYLLVVIR